jgi:tetratricopeptide (TPR) repeat protein
MQGTVRRLLTHPRRLLLALVLLGIIGAAGAVAAGQVVAEYHYRAARRALDDDDYDEAVRHLASCLETWPNSAAAHLLAARTARRSGDPERADEHLHLAKRCGADADALALERLLAVAQTGELTAEQERYLKDRAENDDPERPQILEALGRGYARAYRLDDALAALTAWLDMRPGQRAALLKRSWVYERLHRLAEAEADCRRVTDVNPDDAEALLRRAQLVLAQERCEEAAPIFEKLYESRRGQAAVAVGLARAYRGLGRLDEAERILDEVCAALPGEGPALLERGRLALQARGPAAAESWLRRAAEREPWDYAVNYALFQCLEAMGDKAEADKVGRRVANIQADLERMADLTDALQRAPHSPDLRCDIGKLFVRHGEAREGRIWLQSALQADPTYRPAREALAELDERGGKTAPAAP